MRFLTYNIAAFLACLFVCSLAAADEPDASQTTEKQGEAAATQKQALVTVGPDTTVLTEPLDEEGYVDYQAHANALMSEGVAPRNNAAVLLAQMLGPNEIAKEQRAAYYKQLGIDPLPEDGEYFRDVDEFADEDAPDDVWDQLDVALSRPWASHKFPLIARWVKANEKPLAVAMRASRRGKMFQPLMGGPPLVNAAPPQLNDTRGVARGLTARAMLRAADGDVDAAIGDLMAVHRLAALHDQGLNMVDSLVAVAIDRTALNAEAGWAHSGKLTAKQARDMQARIAALQPFTPMKDPVDTMERYTFLDSVAAVARDPDESYKEFLPPYLKTESHEVDWNETLRYGNGWYDRLVAALNQPTFVKQKEELDAIDDDLREIVRNGKSGKRKTALLLARGEARKKLLGKEIGELLVLMHVPIISAANDGMLMHHAQRQLVPTSFALAGYKKDHGKYPDDLVKLTPDYMKELPQDVFSGTPALYKSDGEDYLLYSVGPNLKDDGGFGRQDDVDFDADDIAIRTSDKTFADRK